MESRGNLPTIQIPQTEQLAKAELGVNHMLNVSQDRLALTKEAKTQARLYKQNIYHRKSDVICLVGSALIKPQGMQDKAASVRHCPSRRTQIHSNGNSTETTAFSDILKTVTINMIDYKQKKTLKISVIVVKNIKRKRLFYSMPSCDCHLNDFSMHLFTKIPKSQAHSCGSNQLF